MSFNWKEAGRLSTDNLRMTALVVLGTIVILSLGPTPLRLASLEAAESESLDVRCLALTVYWEARAGGRKAMEAVAWVALNRLKSPKFPDTICAVVRQGGESAPCQFSYWCDGQPDTPENDDAWRLARQIAAQMLKKPPPDPTGGALFFHTVKTSPSWAKERKRTVEIGGHIFYR